MSCKRYHTIFSTISLKFKFKISIQKEVIRRLKNHILVTWPATNLLILRWLDTVFQGQYLPSLSVNYVAINKDLEKLTPQLY